MKKWNTTTIKVPWENVGEEIAKFANKLKLGPGEISFAKIDPPMPSRYVITEIAIIYYS